MNPIGILDWLCHQGYAFLYFTVKPYPWYTKETFLFFHAADAMTSINQSIQEWITCLYKAVYILNVRTLLPNNMRYHGWRFSNLFHNSNLKCKRHQTSNYTSKKLLLLKPITELKLLENLRLMTSALDRITQSKSNSKHLSVYYCNKKIKFLFYKAKTHHDVL